MNLARITTLLALAAATIAASPGKLLAQQQDFSKVQIVSQPLTEQLHLLTGAGGNMALLIGPDGAVLVDDQFAPLVPKIRSAIALLTDRPVRFVLNTHWHGDHTGGNEAFGGTGSVIVAHANTRKRMSTRQFVDLFKSEVLPANPAALPVVTFDDGVTLHLNGETITARHVAAAHTDSDVVLYFETSNVVHAGDVFITPAYPFVDLTSGGTINGLILALDDILARTDAQTRVIPGHGPLSTRADVEAYRDMLVVVRDRVVRALRAGRSLQQVLDARPSSEFDARFGGSFITPEVFVSRTYQDLSRR